jgi:hypothetical protein
VYSRYYGNVTGDDTRRHIEEVCKDDRFEQHRYNILDFSNATDFNPSERELLINSGVLMGAAFTNHQVLIAEVVTRGDVSHPTPSDRPVRCGHSPHSRWAFARTPEVVARLHVEPHLGAGPKCSLEAQRHRCADAGTPVQQRGKSLPGNAKPLGDLTDRYSLGEILAEHVAGVRWIVHVAHGDCLSLVVQIIDEFDVLPNESEYHAPVAVDRDRVEPPELAGQGMQTPSVRREIARLRRGIQCRQLQP